MESINSEKKTKSFYSIAGQFAGWISVILFALAVFNKLNGSEILFNPSDLLQAALYLILFAIFSAMVAINQQ
jgi:hypothetical protein